MRFSIQVLKIVESKQQGGDQLTIWLLVSHEHPALPKTNLTKQCKSISKTSVPCVLVNISVLEKGNYNAEPVATTKLQ